MGRITYTDLAIGWTPGCGASVKPTTYRKKQEIFLMGYYILKNKTMPWGDYGEILWQGIYFFNKKKNRHTVLRTAPFCPAIYRSQYDSQMPVLIVNEYGLDILDSSNLIGYVANKIYKEKIVKLEWESWDLDSDEPKIYPAGDMDAEEYITRRKHNEALSEKLGDLYALTFEKQSYTYKGENGKYFLSCTKTISSDFFVADEMRNREIYVSDRGKDILQKYFAEYLTFEEILVGVPDNCEELELRFSELEELRKKEEAMTSKDWQRWHHLKSNAEKLIRSIDVLKTESAKQKRKEKILQLLNEANSIYPIKYEKWMGEFLWEEFVSMQNSLAQKHNVGFFDVSGDDGDIILPDGTMIK